MIAEGYGFEYTFRLPYRYQAEFQAGAARGPRGWPGALGPWRVPVIGPESETTGMALLTILLSALGGALVSGLFQFGFARYSAFKEGQAAAAAMRAELDMLVDLINYRKYVDQLTSKIARLNDDTWQFTVEDVFRPTVAQDYLTLFDTLRPKLSLFGQHVSETVARAHMAGKIVIENFHALGKTWDGLENREIHDPSALRKVLLHGYAATKDALERFIGRATEASEALCAYHNRSWWAWVMEGTMWRESEACLGLLLLIGALVTFLIADFGTPDGALLTAAGVCDAAIFSAVLASAGFFLWRGWRQAQRRGSTR